MGLPKASSHDLKHLTNESTIALYILLEFVPGFDGSSHCSQAAHSLKTPRYPAKNLVMSERISEDSAADANPRMRRDVEGHQGGIG